MNVKRLCGFALALLLAFRCMALPAAASGRFADVPADSVYGESVAYLVEHGITRGAGNHCYCPERPVTVSEWAVLLFRALDGSGLDSYPSDKQAEFCIQQCYQKEWLYVREVLSPETVLCRGNLLLSAFRAFGLPVYDSTLYGDAPMSPLENALRVGRALELCPEGASPSEEMTRGDAAVLLHTLLTQTLEVATPPLLNELDIQAESSADLNRFLLEINRVPAPILQAFCAAGWEFHVAPAYMQAYSERRGTDYGGLTVYAEKRIYVSASVSVIHEFGHFLAWELGFPPEHDALYCAEQESARTVLRDYAVTNSQEYFADYFSFWIRNSDDKSEMERLKAATPQTYAYFAALEACGWTGSS